MDLEPKAQGVPAAQGGGAEGGAAGGGSAQGGGSSRATTRAPRDHELRVLLHRADLAARLQRLTRLHALDVPEVEVRALEHLATEGSLTVGEVGRRVGLSSGGTSGLVTRLEREGFISINSHPGDARARILSLTPEGLEHARYCLRAIEEPTAEAVAFLSDRDRAALGRFLRILIALREQAARSEPLSDTANALI